MFISRRPAFRVFTLLVLSLLLSTSNAAATVPIRDTGAISDASTPSPTSTATPSPEPIAAAPLAPTLVPTADTTTRPKPSPRPFVNPVGQPEPTATPTPEEEATPTPTATIPAGPPRLNDMVLRWLPEIMIAANATGVPPELIAAIMRLESQGNPNIISPAGARGLMQVMPDELSALGIPFDAWHDPATNIMAGATILLQRSGSGWAGAAGAYFGYGCDVFGTCTDTYISVVMGWMAYYAPIVAAPYASGFGVLGPDWSPPAIAPFVEAAPPTPEPAPTPSPAPTVAPTSVAEPTATATSVPPTEEPTVEPTLIPPTEVPPTEVPPTEAPPTEVPPTAAPVPPTDIPTEEPPPTDAPAAVTTQPDDEVLTDDGSGG